MYPNHHVWQVEAQGEQIEGWWEEIEAHGDKNET